MEMVSLHGVGKLSRSDMHIRGLAVPSLVYFQLCVMSDTVPLPDITAMVRSLYGFPCAGWYTNSVFLC